MTQCGRVRSLFPKPCLLTPPTFGGWHGHSPELCGLCTPCAWSSGIPVPSLNHQEDTCLAHTLSHMFH